MSTSPALGIDFGTTKTVAAVYQDGLPQVLWSRNGKRAMPSRVALTKENKILAGWDSENTPGAADHQPFTISAIKRALGKPGQANWSLWSTSPQEVAALLLGRLKREAEAGLQRPVRQTVIAIPAHFDVALDKRTERLFLRAVHQSGNLRDIAIGSCFWVRA